MKTIKQFDFSGKKALVRVDFNVPQDENLKVTDNTRITAVKPTIEKILSDGGSVILMTHLGRPKGEKNDKYSLKHILPEIEKILGKSVKFAQDCIGEEAVKLAKKLTKKGKSCIMSPAAASYGIFKNFEERGEVFKRLVKGEI